MYNQMKYFLWITLGVMLLPSCGKQLDLYPYSSVTPGNVTESDLEPLINGLYNVVQNRPGRESYVMFDLVGGNMINAAGGNQLVFINNILRPEQGLMSTAWNGYYAALYQVNNAMESVEPLPDSEKKRRLLGTAHFFRALIYYNLVTRWGGVPILRVKTEDKLPRDTEAAVWAFIEEDLTAAIPSLPSFATGLNGNYFYLSQEAAQALMARVKLMTGKTEEAAIWAEAIITSNQFQLDDFSRMFRGQDNNEVIFSFVNLNVESSVNLSTMFYTYAHPVGGSYVYKPNDEVLVLYGEDDKRKAISIDTYEGLDVVNKYSSGQAGTDPIIVIRLAEIYLISAEAQGMAGLPRLNGLRHARNLPPIAPANETEYESAVTLERRRELFAEGFRYYDLVRRGEAVETLGIDPSRQKFPIPENELILNELMTQNDGYN
ncbi:RagB/SusD family nutrient uptake outer membrane protein [Parapedobacter tibetensis]|uniref:RagB/SusD family nutrient uptake outer membrane protein n=1 Tax=Parapedobacter tibetensis TaxID=2972951 RepID=UPI00214DB10D|nr:RagB/SusD family nutrient uptake outer membrane protein [Parapedobacter tibetensis]